MQQWLVLWKKGKRSLGMADKEIFLFFCSLFDFIKKFIIIIPFKANEKRNLLQRNNVLEVSLFAVSVKRFR